ncbi:MAG: insulinase family protein [Lachnospiraceae bacterium]|nr:insulinase family protein [Lachnospiraceae bacterium]
MTINHSAYELIQTEFINEINSDVSVLRHKKSGARLMLLSNDDNNKVFNIAFRTPPVDNTGLPHILEHSVLCGSDKYPVKEVFVELCKGSLNTFLNAMTYPDKTVYPVASCNDKDFQNLMDVYLSSVLHSSIYDHPEIFMQEGWHYELESADAPITINGVVYNEMKGAFSAPDEVISRYMKQALFPDNAYGFESGGDPDYIPELTYEQFIAFHKKYYHPANSYIFLYGNMDMEEKLAWLDREYLSKYDYLAVDSEIGEQKPFEKGAELTVPYSIGEDEETSGKTYLALAGALNFGMDSKMNMAFRILDYALLGVPGAPLKQALLDAGIGKDIYGGYDDGMKQHMFNVVAKDTDVEKKNDFVQVIRDTLTKVCEEGLDKQTLRAGLSHFEFRYREADFGSMPKGLVYSLQSLESWLYDEDQPFLFLSYEDDFAWLKEKMEEPGFFEGLIKTWLLDNPHMVQLALVPEPGLAAKKEAELAAKLAEKKASMSTDEVNELVEQVRKFKEYQEQEDSEEDLKKIPLLSVSDISPEAEKFVYEEKELAGHTVIHTDLFTGGINYAKILFPIDGMTADELHWLTLLTNVWGLVDTENYSYLELSNEVNIQTGGMGCGVNAYQSLADGKKYRSFMEISFKALHEKTGKALEMVEEVLLRSKFDSEKRLREIIRQNKSGMQGYLMQASHGVAVNRAQAYGSGYAAFGDHAKGYGFYQFIEELEADFEERKGEIIDRLNAMAVRCLQGNAMLQITADNEGYSKFAEAVVLLLAKVKERCGSLAVETEKAENQIGALGLLNEGFKTPGMVQYVARTGNFREAGYEYTGALLVLKTLLGYDYLWTNLRIKGGAYGCMCGFGKSGDAYMVSYRDPNLTRTNEIYQAMPEYIEKIELDERERTKYIIGTISDLDTPRSAHVKGSRAFSAWLSGVTDEMAAKERREILNCTETDIRALAPIIRAVLAADRICVVGSEEKIEEAKDLFNEVKPLFK